MICFEKIQKNVWNLNTYASSHFPSITCEIRLQKQVLTSICHKMWQVNAGYVIFFYDITCIMKGGKFYPINPPRHPEKQYTPFTFNKRLTIKTNVFQVMSYFLWHNLEEKSFKYDISRKIIVNLLKF